MKALFLTILLAIVAMPVMAAEETAVTNESWLKPVEPQYVCMVNDTAFDREQIAVEADGKTYYGCCAMCKERLQKDVSVRTATDPVSGNKIDKASAVIGEDPQRKTYYFENLDNFQTFASGHMPEMDEHMGGMMMDNGMMEPEMKEMHRKMWSPESRW